MKKNILAVLPFLVILMLLAGCSQPAANTDVQTRNSTAGQNNGAALGGAATPAAKPAGETKEPVHSGTCQLAKAPTIDGFTIGQSVDQVAAIVPGFDEAYKKEKARETESNRKIDFTLLTSGSLPQGNPFEKANPDKSYIWHFLDDKLMAFVVKQMLDDEPEPKAFVTSLAKENGLPVDGWDFGPEGGADLSCMTFDVMITTGGQPGTGIMITDKEAFKQKEQRIKDDK